MAIFPEHDGGNEEIMYKIVLERATLLMKESVIRGAPINCMITLENLFAMLEAYRYDTLCLPWMATAMDECRKGVYGSNINKIDLIDKIQTLLRQWSNVYNFSLMRWEEAEMVESFFALLLEKIKIKR